MYNYPLAFSVLLQAFVTYVIYVWKDIISKALK